MTASTDVVAAPWRPRAAAAFRAADAARWLSRRLSGGGGGTVPGRVALALYPDALGQLAAPHRVVLLSGTNGKTTTTLLLAKALGALGPVISNSDGANLSSGVVSTLLRNRRSGPSWAVLEVDEIALTGVLARTRPEMVVLLNLSRDQLDRTSEVRDHVDRWAKALRENEPPLVVANADDPLVVAAVRGGRPDGTGTVWVGAGKPYWQDASLCPSCDSAWSPAAQDWTCAVCGLSRPAARWRLDGEQLLLDDQPLPLQLALPGRANMANALVAAAAAHALGVPVEDALARMQDVQEVQGRYSRVVRDGHDLRLLLAKNPAGWLEALDQIASSDEPVLLSVNAKDADGHDPSWLYDVPYERLQGRTVVAMGDRRLDLAVRLTYADVDHQVAPDLRSALALLPKGNCAVVANYTAFVDLRAQL